jgi:hypothetical protein
MDTLITALGPAFAAGFALQRLLEILDPLLEKWNWLADNKKIIHGIVSLVVGLILAIGFGLHVMKPLGVNGPEILDVIVTAFIVSAGTEGFNSIMKFLGYAKENKKAVAADNKSKVSVTAIENLETAV